MDLNHGTVVWTADAQPELRPILRRPEHDVNFTWLDFGARTATHIDAPYYLFSDKWTADQIPLERTLGPCRVIDVSEVTTTITADDLRKHDIRAERILLRTNNSFDPMAEYNPEHVDLSVDAAEYLLECGITTIGYDYQSFERGGATVIHRIFLERQITVIDNLRLADAPAGDYTLICLPLKITGIDAALCRALLLPS